MSETRLFVVTECYQKCKNVARPRSGQNTKKSQVRGHGKMPKIRRSAVTKICQKVTGPRSRKMQKMLKSAFNKKCLKHTSPLSWNDIKNAKKLQVGVNQNMPKSRWSVFTKKCEKVAGPRSRKNAKKS